MGVILILLSFSCEEEESRKVASPSSKPTLLFPGEERYLANIRQLTFKGSNAEAYFSSDGKKIIFQSRRGKYHCDQIFTMNLDGSQKKLVSTGKGKCTCGYFLGGKDSYILYSSTHHYSPKCPPKPDRSHGYVWPLYPSYDIFLADQSGKILKQLTKNPHYDAEATVSTDGKKIVFTSLRRGDVDIYTMDVDGTNLRRITRTKGYDGGPFFSPDGKWIVYRAYHPKTREEIEEFDKLLARNLVRPSTVELFIIGADGRNRRQLTHNGKANFAPFFHPNGRQIIFCSNLHGGHTYELYLVDVDGKNLRRVTFSGGFTSFPMFSPDGKKLLFVSNRNSKNRHEFHIFIGDWIWSPSKGK
ncbi:MAG: hypothetical protein D6805_00280 [Planctomycetota bacterium]|nr:MAG: hypothetical protein D6805_00280 [Planctomycetota bacterium]